MLPSELAGRLRNSSNTYQTFIKLHPIKLHAIKLLPQNTRTPLPLLINAGDGPPVRPSNSYSTCLQHTSNTHSKDNISCDNICDNISNANATLHSRLIHNAPLRAGHRPAGAHQVRQARPGEGQDHRRDEGASIYRYTAAIYQSTAVRYMLWLWLCSAILLLHLHVGSDSWMLGLPLFHGGCSPAASSIHLICAEFQNFHADFQNLKPPHQRRRQRRTRSCAWSAPTRGWWACAPSAPRRRPRRRRRRARSK